jgi:hypothetical protein
MQNLETYVEQISTALELTPDQKEKITIIFAGFKDNEKLQLISQTQSSVDELIKADEQIKTLKTGSLSQYMDNIQANWNIMSENLVQLQILSLIQKKGADCSEVINDLLKILNTKLTTVNQILKANLGEASSKTTSTPSGLQKEVLGKAEEAVKLAATKSDTDTKSAAVKPVDEKKPTAVKPEAKPEAKSTEAKSTAVKTDTAAKSTAIKPEATKASLASVVAKAKVDTGLKLSNTSATESAAAKAAATESAVAKAAAALKAKAGTKPSTPPAGAAAAKQQAPPASTPPAGAAAAAKQPGAASTAASPAASPAKQLTSTATKLSTAATTLKAAEAAKAPPGAVSTPAKLTGAKGGADDIYLYKYLKYKSKYLSLKNNF